MLRVELVAGLDNAMRIFIDEGGTFVPSTGWGVVCSLALPHREVGPTRREIDRLTKEWPHRDGELNASGLEPRQQLACPNSPLRLSKRKAPQRGGA